MLVKSLFYYKPVDVVEAVDVDSVDAARSNRRSSSDFSKNSRSDDATFALDSERSLNLIKNFKIILKGNPYNLNFSQNDRVKNSFY